MNQKTLIGLAVAALVAIAVAFAVNRSNQPRSEGRSETETAYLVPELRDHVNDVDKVVITGADSKTIATLTRGTNGWAIAEKNGFAADTGKLREFLLKLADAKLVEQKTSNKEKYAALGVEDVTDKDAKSVEIELGGLNKPVKVLIGNGNQHGGTFVRRAGEPESWLASGTLTIEKKSENWLRKDLTDIAATRVASVDITRPDGKSVRIAKTAEADANFKLADVPKGREAGSDYTINGPASTLAGLKFDDAVPAKDAPPAEKPLKARFATFDGLVVDVTAWEKDGKDYAQLSASEDEKAATAHIDAEQAKAKADDAAKSSDAKAADAKATDAKPEPPAADPVKDRETKLAALKKEVDDLNARFKDWTFVLPPYKYAAINKAPDDFLKPVEDKNAAKKDGADAKKPGPAKKPKSG
ncbi:MAG TPA: DUF4340 domain-containing protein [Rhodanobacteraceae bacterium]